MTPPLNSRRSKSSKREGEGLTQNPARERELTYSKSSKREKELFKIQQERDNELFKIQHLNEVEESGNAARAVGVFCREKCTTHVCVREA